MCTEERRIEVTLHDDTGNAASKEA